ncbi:hypothetical protein BsWGS_21993 [Bradybaena similaris]
MLVFGSITVTAQISQIYRLCEPFLNPVLELSAVSLPFFIRSPNYPNPYPVNAQCSLILQSGFEPLVLTFKVSTFQTEANTPCTMDYLCIHGIKFCGQWVAGNEFQFIVPENKTLTLFFRSDGSNSGSGFNIIVKTDVAQPGQVIYQPQDGTSDETLVRFSRVRYPSTLPYLDVCN